MNKKLQITITALLFLLSININAQITLPKNNKISNVKLKNNQYKDLKFITGGNQGFVYAETANHGVGKKLANVELTFKSEKGGRIQKIKTNKYGNYKIRLQPGRYIVTVKHASYKSYSTAPGFSVVNSKFGTFNIPLQKLLKYPIKNKGYNIIAVFNTKTKKMIDIVLLDKNNKQGIKKRPNTTMFYGKLTNAKKQIAGKSFYKGNTIEVFLGKKYILSDAFITGDQFLPGDAFTLNNTKFKILKKSKEVLKMVVL